MQKNKKEAEESKSGIRKYFYDVFNIRDDMMSYEEIDEMMEENTVIHGANMWILMLAVLIASIGLNVNSTAVIIGAMLISPLMSGIMTMGFSLAVRDLTLLKKSLTRFGTQVAISLLAATIYFLITPLNDPTSEMIARTSPTLWDVMIALFGGIAGMIGNTRQKKGNVIPGVAIATALMPPLCTAGYGIATLQPRFIFGAFYLFLINTLFITLSSALIAAILGVPRHKYIRQAQQKRINRVVIAITIITIIPSVYIGMITVRDSVIARNVSSYLSNEFVFPDTQVVQTSTDKQNKVISVSLVGVPVADEVLTVLEKEMSRYNLEGYTLHVTQNSFLAEDGVEDTDKITIAVQENTISELQAQLEEEQEKLAAMEQDVKAYEAAQQEAINCQELSKNAAVIFERLDDCSCGIMSDSKGEYIMFVAETVEPLTEEEKQALTNWLKNETGIERIEILEREKVEEAEEIEDERI
ncbi:MAG: DUF389 domain-containing protein [Bacteroides sp.]|nr:DUF389 domain-containing protein [Bacteroides sp.]MCM1550902.1 DUF389 domain-containing protein [Clostridium sp.]